MLPRSVTSSFGLLFPKPNRSIFVPRHKFGEKISMRGIDITKTTPGRTYILIFIYLLFSLILDIVAF